MANDTERLKGKVCFIRVRVMKHWTEVQTGSTRDEWCCQQISKSGRDIEGSAALWAMPESMLTVDEVRAAVKGERKEDAR